VQGEGTAFQNASLVGSWWKTPFHIDVSHHKGHPFMTSTRRGSGSCEGIWTGQEVSPIVDVQHCPHRKLEKN